MRSRPLQSRLFPFYGSIIVYILSGILWQTGVYSKITIFHTNDIHQFAPSLHSINESSLQYARLHSLFLSYPHALKLNTQGIINNQLNWISSKGLIETDLFNLLGYHATGLD